MPLLTVEDLKVYFKTLRGISRVVEDLNFTLEEGESISLVGESGSGKTTVLKAILHLLAPNAIVEGKIYFGGVDILNASPEVLSKIRGSKISYIPQEPLSALNPLFTIKEHFLDRLVLSGKSEIGLIEYFRVRRGLDESLKDKILDFLERVKIADGERVLESYPLQLSGGMLQRVLIALAIATEPNILLADEPTTALDVMTQREILDLLKELQGKYKLSIVYVTHNLGVARNISDKVIIMYAGHTVEYGGTEEVLSDPLHPYSKGLIESIPKLVGGELKGIEGGLIDYYNPPLGCRFHPRCPYATEVCKSEKPKPVKIEGRIVYCWLYSSKEGKQVV